ncbi:metalloprotease TldD [Azospirillum sp. CT11-132]|uniref:metalloprotease TldD n=1 Tax=unclassified Azospirillum TaxID=2630922 RepID=UPI000D61FA84|nr:MULTISPECIES: metalloprotease TldD [unclassified Azospirillum]PWC58590.1 protease TldD [Azospirillum sp. TSH7]PWC72324.1 protease TldD [Azospirillum sp. TSH20]PWC88947.1 protease TldD [Azospirillum sp. TSO5]QCG98873.1 metalloprotease TldD [Azospirillum sp. TSA2s]
MSALAVTDDLFFNRAGMDRARVEGVVQDALHSADDGELYLEYAQSESLGWDDGKLKSASFDTTQGFGLRAIAGEATGYAHASNLSEEAIRRAAATVRAVQAGHTGTLAEPPAGTNRALYIPDNPLHLVPFEEKVKLLADIDAYARAKDERVRQVSCSISGEWQAVQIMRADGVRVADLRPLVRLNVSVVVAEGDRMETGGYGGGGRVTYEHYIQPETWRGFVDEALRQALVNLASVPAPAGEMTVVLGSGWPGILLHEAIGHGLEGDFNRKKTSAFSGLMGQRIAAPGVTIVDDGTIENSRGSISVDDEGTPGQCTTLIEDGILVGFMQDRMNARLMGMRPTGNGRRQSFAYNPMPRMTNTVMRNGNHTPEEIIASVKKGIYAKNFGGGQVDITNGKFVFSASEAYLIEDGKLGPAVKGATLIGNGPDSLTRVSMIGNDSRLDPGVGTCGKDGQGVPVGVGQPTLKLEGLTVGGTAA